MVFLGRDVAFGGVAVSMSAFWSARARRKDRGFPSREILRKPVRPQREKKFE